MGKRIDVKGVIIPNDYQWIYDWLEWEATSPNKVDQAIQEANGDDLEVVINSGGGDVYAGSEIYTMLKDYKGNVTVKIVGLAASAASVIAMAGKKVMISPTAQIMIHNVASRRFGDYRDHAHESDVLRNWNKSIANAYRLKSGLSQEELLELMNQETWLNAQQAKEKGFVDEIMFDEGNQLSLVASTTEMIPQKVIDKLRNELINLKKGVNENMGNTQNQTIDNQVTTAVPQNQINNLNSQVDLIAQERARLKAIDEIAANIDPELVREAKYGENPMTAEQLAFRAMKEGRMINNAIFDAAVQANKAAGTDGVQALTQPQGTEKEYDLNNISDVNAIFASIAARSQIGRPQNIRKGVM